MKRKLLPKDQKGAGGVPKCTGSAVCFSRRWVLMKPKLRLRFAQPSARQSGRSRFHSRSARRAALQNTGGKKESVKGRLTRSDNFFINSSSFAFGHSWSAPSHIGLKC